MSSVLPAHQCTPAAAGPLLWSQQQHRVQQGRLGRGRPNYSPCNQFARPSGLCNQALSCGQQHLPCLWAATLAPTLALPVGSNTCSNTCLACGQQHLLQHLPCLCSTRTRQALSPLMNPRWHMIALIQRVWHNSRQLGTAGCRSPSLSDHGLWMAARQTATTRQPACQQPPRHMRGSWLPWPRLPPHWLADWPTAGSRSAIYILCTP
jgi:hypothetical protein